MSSSHDILWINLKILASLPAYSKLNTKNELFYIEQNTFSTPISIYRFFRGDSRLLAIKRIDDLFEKASSILEKHKDPNLIQHLQNTTSGLQNMKKTYQNDITTIAALDRLLDKIQLLTVKK